MKESREFWEGKLEAYKELKQFCDSIIPVLEVAIEVHNRMDKKEVSH